MDAIVPQLPAEVLDYVRSVFAECRKRAATKMSRMPTTHETALDLSIIDCILEFGAPQRLAARWVVRLDAHYLGGGRHFGEWEIGDIGLIVVIRERGVVRLRKLAILQSKRLYPNEQSFEEDTPLDYAIGFRRLMVDDIAPLPAEEIRLFTFDDQSRYRALCVGDHQYGAIEQYEMQSHIQIHYLLHHPLTVPWQQTIPVPSVLDFSAEECRVGAMVMRAQELGERFASNNPTIDRCTPIYPAPKRGRWTSSWLMRSSDVERATSLPGQMTRASIESSIEGRGL
ncbi:MAG: hypothetical protein ACRDJ2_17055 [Actinomycetota bacterium]